MDGCVGVKRTGHCCDTVGNSLGSDPLGLLES
jgi:hypothetical protein